MPQKEVKKVKKTTVAKTKKKVAKKPVVKKKSTVKAKAVKKDKIVKKTVEAKEVVKEVKEKVIAPKKASLFSGKYFYAVGRRKRAIVKVKLFDSFGKEEIFVNGKKLGDYLTVERHQDIVREPFIKLGKEKQYCVEAKALGGGINAQAEALRLGIARAMVVMDEELRKPLKDLNLLTRDSRKVERKKAGLKKARRAPQWSKR